MKHINIKFLVLFLLTCSFWSCKKELNVYPTTSEVDGNIIVDAKSAATVLNGVYYRFASAGADNNGVPSVQWSFTLEAMPSDLCGSAVIPGGGDDFGSLTYTPISNSVDFMWTYGYNLVNAANGFLKNVDPVNAIPVAQKTQMQAEAKFLRAFGNSELLFYYGQYYDVNSRYGIILRDGAVDVSNINVPRSGVAAVYTSILADLDVAIAGLPTLNTQVFYANLWTAKLLKARVLISRAAAGDYAQVISLTDDIIKNGPFQLEANVKDIFLTKGFASKEVMLGVQPYPTETYKFQQYQYYNQYVATDTLKNSMQNDPRNQWLYQNVTDSYYGVIPQITKYYSGDVNTISQTPLSEYCYAFRLTEAYLLKAEAIAASGGDLTTAKSLLKTVLSHAGITDYSAVDAAGTPAAVREMVIREEMKNFFAENGTDWLALRRLPFATVQRIRPEIKSVTSLILPIPNSEIITNNKIEQNPGY